MTGAQDAASSGARRKPAVLGWLLAGGALVLLGIGGYWAFIQVQDAAREAPRIARCQSNLRDIGRAVQLYAQDYDGTLPSTATGRGDVTGLLERYLGPRRMSYVWRCPSQFPFAGGTWTSSYGYNWQYLLAAGPDYPHQDWNGFANGGMKLASITRPAQTLMFVDQKPVVRETWAQLWTYVVRPGQPLNKPDELDGMGQTDFRHRGKTSVLFVDGHVALMGTEVNNEKKHWSPR
jgi:prepilin-type processing-associated H-X9-DG protein